MSKYSTDISNMSYTNKDFGTIYPELLEVARKLSYKWDPATSDESDPGVVLLKLAAIIADKNNYNIDKNILETFPNSVTQVEIARQLYEQLGYSMRHYISADTVVSISINEEPELDAEMLGATEEDLANDVWVKSHARSYDFPRFTMVSDTTDEIVYTITEPITIGSDKRLKDFPAIQGIIKDYTINNDPTIMSSALDYNNRLYFNDVNVAENGIFIASVGTEDYYKWYPVDNLSIQPMGSYCYKFGVSPSDGRCFIEFPSDAENLIGEGIILKYVTSAGKLGNVGKNRLKKFFADTHAYVYLTENGSHYGNDNQILVTGDNVTILNYNSATNGRDPETLEEAYSNYEKIKTTFDTLVSLSDYTNYLTRQDFTNPFTSNGFVCDRTNDVQSAYKVVDENGESEVVVHSSLSKITSPIYDSEGNELDIRSDYYLLADDLTAFDLRIYALQYSNTVNTLAGFKSTFDIVFDDNNDIFGVSGYKDSIQKIKTIQHDFKAFKPGEIIILKNKYPIVVKIVPQYKVDTQQMIDMVSNVRTSLCNTLNSKALNFGDAPDYNVVYDAIMNSDNRIKAIILDEFEYQTYAVYTVDNRTAIEVRLDAESVQPDELTIGDRTPAMTDEYWEKYNLYSPSKMWAKFRSEIYAKSILAGVTPLYPNKNDFTYSLQQLAQSVTPGINKITTNLTLGLSTEQAGDFFTGKITLLDNESVTFSMPSLVKEQQYSSYVKYLIHTTPPEGKKEILADSEYELTDDDFIIFFWKASDKDQFYTYKKYTRNSKAKFICPNITLPAISPNYKNAINWDAFRSFPEGNGTTALMDSSIYELIKSLAGDSWVLSGDTTIDTKCPSTVHLNDTSTGADLITWYLNSSKEGMDTVLFSDGQTRYTLQNGESFIYSNKAKSHIVALGAGTVIERSGSDLSKWTCPYFNYSKFVSNPIEYLDEIAKPIPDRTNVYAHEMQFYQIGPGNTIKLTWKKSSNFGKDWDSRLQELKEIYANMDGDDKPATEDEYLANNMDVRVYIKDDSTQFGSDVSIQGKNFSYSGVTISYLDEGGSETTLPNRISADSNWEAHAVLNMNCSPDVYQTIISDEVNTRISKETIRKQSMMLLTDSYNESTEEGMVKVTNSNILVDNITTVYGGKLVDVSYLDMYTGKIKPIEVYIYTDTPNKEVNGGKLNYKDFQSVLVVTKDETPIEENPSVVSIDLPVGIPSGTYILTLTQSAGDMCTISPNGQDLELTPIRKANGVPGKSFYLLSVPTDTEGKELNISCVPIKESDITITIDSLYMTENAPLPDDMTVDSLLTLINLWDKNSRYNFTYQVPSSDIIDNPLDSYSFSYDNHPYNYATIYEWDVYDDVNNKIDVTNKIK